MPLSAMTVNERFVALGLSDAFEEACVKKNENRIREILKAVLVDEESISSIVLKYLQKSG